MNIVRYALRDERINIYGMTHGCLNGSYPHQFLLCKKKPFLSTDIGPLALIPKLSRSNYRLSPEGAAYIKLTADHQYGYNYVAEVDSCIRIKIIPHVFELLHDEGLFALWNPDEAYRYYEGAEEGYLVIFRVFEIAESLNPSYFEKGAKGRNFYFRLEIPAEVNIVSPVIPDQEYEGQKNDLVSLLDSYNYLVDVDDTIPNIPARRNPPWTRDELILALDLYFRHNPNTISESHEEVMRLSNILNELPIHPIRPDGEKFRNPSGVYMKMCDFLRLDPSYQGTGLSRGGKLEVDIWNEFHDSKDYLNQVARAIRDGGTSLQASTWNNSGDSEFPEGRILYREHCYRERNQTVVRKLKAEAMARNDLKCCICGFDFYAFYGEIGLGYIECHHTTPVSEYTHDMATRKSDLILVCANCHRMLHVKRPWLTGDELKDLLKSRT